MTKALSLSAFVLALATPFVDFVYVGALGIAVFIGLIAGVWLRHREPEVDEAQLQCQLSEFVRDLNREG